MPGFQTAILAEAAFYIAFASGNPNAMNPIWADDPSVVCIHPHGERLQGYSAVIESWNAILPGMSEVIVRPVDAIVVTRSNLSIHHLRELLYVEGQRRGVVLATNIYRQTSAGWQMIAHHASPDPSPPPILESPGIH